MALRISFSGVTFGKLNGSGKTKYRDLSRCFKIVDMGYVGPVNFVRLLILR
jgi:hypothetical protein